MVRPAAVVTVLLALAGFAAASEAPLNEKIVAFAKSKLGKTVGDGECSTLADEALAHANARRRGTFSEKPNAGDYVWGELVLDLDAAAAKTSSDSVPAKCKPGDILQFRDTRFEGRKGNGTYWQDAHHHTAILAAISKDGSKITVLHQNWDGNRTVHEQSFALADIKKGWIKIYRAKE